MTKAMFVGLQSISSDGREIRRRSQRSTVIVLGLVFGKSRDRNPQVFEKPSADGDEQLPPEDAEGVQEAPQGGMPDLYGGERRKKTEAR